MGNYGRNFEFRISPLSRNRHGRFELSNVGLITSTTKLAIGAPVVADLVTTQDSLMTNAGTVKMAIGAQAPPTIGGVLVYEWGPAAFAGDDPFLTTYSDKDYAPVGKLVQVVRGVGTKVVFRNTSDRTFLNTRSYTGRTMVAGIGIATPTLVVGDLLTPGTGSDAAGYWAETAVGADAWAVVTQVDNARAEVEAELLF